MCNRTAAALRALIGVTWAFHFTFTCWMIPKNQTDLRDHGTFFSLVVIYLMNLLLLSVMLILASPQITFAAFGADLVDQYRQLSHDGLSILVIASARAPALERRRNQSPDDHSCMRDAERHATAGNHLRLLFGGASVSVSATSKFGISANGKIDIASARRICRF